MILNNQQNNPVVLNEIRKTFEKNKTTCFSYGGASKNVVQVAIKNMSISFNAGEIFGFLGPSGSGKSSIIRLIANDIRPDAGFIKINGKTVNILNKLRFSKYVGICEQHDAFWHDLTLREHLLFYATVKKFSEYSIYKRCNK